MERFREYRKVVAFIVTLALVLMTGLPVGPVGEAYADINSWSAYEDNSPATEGTDFTSSSGIVTIKTEKGLAWLSNMVNGVSYSAISFSGITVKLEKASGGAFDLSGKYWTPIGKDNTHYFAGTLEGQSSIIQNIAIIDDTADNAIGLFGVISGAAIKDLNIVNINASLSATHVGGLAGHATNSTLSAIGIHGNLSDSIDSMGGLLGYGANVSITSSYYKGSVAGSVYTGGLIGFSTGNSTLTKSYNKGTVSGAQYTGGLMGYGTNNTIITSSYNLGTVTGTTTGAVYAGGLVGYANPSRIENSYNAGAVTGTGSSTINTGGLVGYSSSATIEKSYNVGALSNSTANKGGLFGNSSNSTVSACFWDTSTSGVNVAGVSAGGIMTVTGAATTSMQALATFTDASWNFTDTWEMGQSPYGYPILKELKDTLNIIKSGDGSTTYSSGSPTVIDSGITLALDQIDGARLVIKNYLTGDKLAYTGTLPTGVTVSAVYENGTSGILTFIGTASTVDYQTLLRTVTFETTSTDTTSREVEFSLRKYKFVTTTATWGEARIAAEADTTYPSLKGYLATVTSDVENNLILTKVGSDYTWIGASDATTEGAWYWVAGPEAGQQFWSGIYSGTSVGGMFTYWNSGEPNSADEDYLGYFEDEDEDGNMTWNDFSGDNEEVEGYVIEYGGLSTDSSTATKTVTIQASSSSSSRRTAPVVVAPKVTLRFQIANLDSFLTTQTGIEQKRIMDTAPIIHEDRTLLPIRFVAEPLGSMVLWDGIAQKVTITREGATIELWIGNPVAKVNGVDTMIDPDNALVMPTVVPPGRTMLPLRFISETLGCTVEWNAVTQQIMVTEQ